jgi:hypothetical protein
MKILVTLLSIAAMAGCGAAGAPLRPTANLGLSIGSNGVQPSASVGATNGTFSVGANL